MSDPVTPADREKAREWYEKNHERMYGAGKTALLDMLADLVAAGRAEGAAQEREAVIDDLHSRAKELRDVFRLNDDADKLDALAGTYAAILADRIAGSPIPNHRPEPS